MSKNRGPVAFINSLDDMDWLFQVHLHSMGLNRRYYQSAIIFGNEDCPEGIHLYQQAAPSVKDVPLKITFGKKT